MWWRDWSGSWGQSQGSESESGVRVLTLTPDSDPIRTQNERRRSFTVSGGVQKHFEFWYHEIYVFQRLPELELRRDGPNVSRRSALGGALVGTRRGGSAE